MGLLVLIMMMTMGWWWVMHFGAEAEYSADVLGVDQADTVRGNPACAGGAAGSQTSPRVVSASAEASC